MSGTLFIISAASGTGKTTLVSKLCEKVPDLMVSVSYTTRPPRAGEVDGVDYFFVNEDTFEAMVQRGEFLEHELVFGYRYGTPRDWVQDRLREGMDIILEIDWQGARDIREVYKDTVSIFILPPTLATLEKRLRDRGSDDEATIQRRLSEALEEISHCTVFDYLVVNDSLDTALAELQELILSHRENRPYQGPDHRLFAEQLMTEAREIQ